MKYEIIGEPYPAVVCHLQRGEQMKTEKGSMVWMDPVMKMETSTGGGGLGKMFGRMMSGESVFQNIYTAGADGMIAFGSSFPGQILPIQIEPGKDFIAQKMAFLASEMGVSLDVFFNQKLGGFFGGEGFIMQRLSGKGTAFLECDGSLVKYELARGQSMVVDTGNVLGFTGGVNLRVERIKGAKNVVFGGEGLFNTILTGPGTVYLQTMPLSNIADVLAAHMPSTN